jgi:hypothetical protein
MTQPTNKATSSTQVTATQSREQSQIQKPVQSILKKINDKAPTPPIRHASSHSEAGTSMQQPNDKKHVQFIVSLATDIDATISEGKATSDKTPTQPNRSSH